MPDLNGKDLNRRKERRDTCNMKVEYRMEYAGGDAADPITQVNFTTDISYSGMGLYSESPGMAGQRLKIFLRRVYDEPIVGQIRWCKRLTDNLYRLGVNIFSPPSSQIRLF